MLALLALLFAVQIDGNHAISTARIDALPAADPHELVDEISQLYWDHGFINAQVSYLDDDGHPTVHIDEGAQFRLGKVALRGFAPGAERYLTLRGGGVFVLSAVANQRDRLLALHPFGVLLPRTNVDLKRHVVDVTFEWSPS